MGNLLDVGHLVAALVFSIIGVQIKQDLGLNETEFGILVATPILTGSLSRIFLGIWTDRRGRTGGAAATRRVPIRRSQRNRARCRAHEQSLLAASWG